MESVGVNHRATFEQFLIKNRATTSSHPITHTKIPGGKFSIKDEDLDHFYTLYKDACGEAVSNDELPRMTEKPNYYSPLRIDLDFRYLDKTTDRRYTPEMIIAFIQLYMEIMEQWLTLQDDDRLCFVTEKPCAVVDTRKKATDHGEYTIKDGVHLFFPHLLVAMDIQLTFREAVLKRMAPIFADMHLSNTMGDVLDRAVIDKNNWMMFRSRKPKGDPYDLTHIYDSTSESVTEMDRAGYTEDQLIRLLSVRSEYLDVLDQEGGDVQTRVMCQIRIEKQAEMSEHLKEYKIRAAKCFPPKGRNKKKCKPTKKTDTELISIRKLIKALSSSRAESYPTWMEVGWALHNIDERLLVDWVEFSKRASSYQDTAEDDCTKAWEEMRDEGLSYGSLCLWAQKDNPDMYSEIKRQEILQFVQQSLNKKIETGNDKLDESLKEMRIQPYDVATVLYARYKDEFICIDSRNRYGTYYNYTHHHWQNTAGDILLWDLISDKIPTIYMQSIRDIISDANGGDKDSQDVAGSWVGEKESMKRLVKQLENMNTTTFKHNVMQEARALFYDKVPKANDRFVVQLDDRNKHLVGFDNGVFDLHKYEFRAGRPEDYISMSTNIEYDADLDWGDETVEDVMTFVSQVLPDEDERDYVLTLLATFLNGNNRQERFHIWTGSGGNGKSKIIELFLLAIGDYGCNLPVALLTKGRKGSGEASAEVARTKGRRFAVLQEPDVHTKINVGLMKEMTGGDTIQARMLYQDPIEFKPQIKMILTCNQLPLLPYDDEATWRRVRSVEFKSRFVDPEEVTVGDKYSHPKDEELAEKFGDWKEAFIWIILQYYDKWRTNGIKEPKSVIAFTEKYKAQNDQYRDFFVEYIIKDHEATEPIQMKEVWMKYQEWCTLNGEEKKRKPELVKYLEKKLGAPHGSVGKEHSGWMGYRLKQFMDDDDDDMSASLSNDLDI